MYYTSNILIIYESLLMIIIKTAVIYTISISKADVLAGILPQFSGIISVSGWGFFQLHTFRDLKELVYKFQQQIKAVFTCMHILNLSHFLL